jgi:ribose/xylose/arabinose/galactoside ABC-type transport system permease subunit
MGAANLTLKGLAPDLDKPWLGGAARLFVLLLVCALVAVLTRHPERGFVFLNASNLLNVVRNASILIIIGVGQTITLTAKDVDLSCGSVISLTSVVAAIMMNQLGIYFPFAIIAALLIGVGLGLINGLLITYVGLPAFIATYGTLWVVFGFAYLILRGAVVYGFPEGFRFIGNGNLLGIPMPIIVMAIVFVVAYFVLHHTTLGRRFFATGANPQAARMSGVKETRIVIIAYVISGFLAALAGLVLIAYTNGSEATIGASYLLPVLAVVVMGGTSLAGGQGCLTGTLVAALIMAVINNGMNILAIPAIWQQLVVGVMIVGTVLVDRWIGKRA